MQATFADIIHENNKYLLWSQPGVAALWTVYLAGNNLSRRPFTAAGWAPEYFFQ